MLTNALLKCIILKFKFNFIYFHNEFLDERVKFWYLYLKKKKLRILDKVIIKIVMSGYLVFVSFLMSNIPYDEENI